MPSDVTARPSAQSCSFHYATRRVRAIGHFKADTLLTVNLEL
jgi:hypothetical protein